MLPEVCEHIKRGDREVLEEEVCQLAPPSSAALSFVEDFEHVSPDLTQSGVIFIQPDAGILQVQ